MSTEQVLLEREANIATLTLNRPEKLNAVTPAMKRALLGAIEHLADDRDIQVVILAGAGRAFCAGADLTEYPGQTGEGVSAPHHTAVRVLRTEARFAELLRSMPQVTIARINGPCAGVGLSWACAADLRLAASSAVLNTAFLAAGLSGDHGITWLLPRLVGETRARDLMFLPRKLPAAEAERIGLVTSVVPDEELVTFTAGVARRIAGYSPHALRAVKENLADAPESSFLSHLDLESRRQISLRGTPEQIEAMRAVREKRSPHFAVHDSDTTGEVE